MFPDKTIIQFINGMARMLLRRKKIHAKMLRDAVLYNDTDLQCGRKCVKNWSASSDVLFTRSGV